MPRMRTIKQTAEYLRANDPQCALTETAIRRLLLTGALPAFRVRDGGHVNYIHGKDIAGLIDRLKEAAT